MKNPFTQLTPETWFRWVVGILLTLSVVYLLLHAVLPPGSSKTKLTTPDKTTIRSLLYSDTTRLTKASSQPALLPPGPDSGVKPKPDAPQSTTPAVPDGQKPLTAQQRARVFTYLNTTYNLVDTDKVAIRQWIGLFSIPADLLRSLDDYVFPVHSFFWLYDGRLYAEVLFWTWFGLIASLLYSVSESLRKGDPLDPDEIWVHIAKFFYAPLCSLVIFLGLSLVVSDKSVIDRIDYSPNQILVAFVMGFFSGRLVQFLQGIKNLVFPGDTSANAVSNPPAPPAPAGGLTSSDIQQAVEQQGATWRLLYPNVTGIAVQTKQTQGQPTGQLSALFEVTTKVPGLTTGLIPPLLPFTTADGRQLAIPTDVTQVGTTKLAYNPGPALHLGVPVPLGGSLRGNDIAPWGTLGLRLRDSQFDYVLSCYHVLCADLLAQNIQSFGGGNQRPVFVPGEGASPTQIGDVVAGRFSERDDFALVRLTDNSAVGNAPNGVGKPFFDIINQPGGSVVGSMAYMVGARSNKQQGRVLAPYQEGEYTVPGLPIKSMKGLIKTERLADEGDSGAAVYVEDKGRNRVIGLLIGFNQEASYVLPIGDFCTAFNLFIP